MTPRFRQQLEQALLPSSPPSVVQASVASLRAMVEENGIEVYLRPELKTHTKVVYKDRLVYRDGSKDLSSEAHITLTIPPDYHHSMIEHVFHRATELEVEVDVLKCSTTTGKTTGSTVLKLRILGKDESVKQYDSELGEYLGKVNVKTGHTTGKHAASHKIKNINKGGGFWKWFFGSAGKYSLLVH